MVELVVGLPVGVRPVGFYFPNGRANYLIINNISAPVGKFWHTGTPSSKTNGPASGWKSKSQRINDIRDLYLLVHQIGTAAFVDDSDGLVVHGNHA